MKQHPLAELGWKRFLKGLSEDSDELIQNGMRRMASSTNPKKDLPE